MSEIAHLAATIFRRGARHQRFIVAIAGPPGAGKSTLAGELDRLMPEGSAAIIPMDGFHYDDAVLDRLDLRNRKGAPETFDVGGFGALLGRIRGRDADVAIPVFDRTMELARAGARLIAAETKFILVEGNYLLLDEEPWSKLASYFDLTVFIDVPRAELERRLLQRWREHGRADGPQWVAGNDMPNVDRVLSRRRRADIVI